MGRLSASETGVRHHDRYQASGFVDPTGRYREATFQDLIEVVS